MNARISEIPLDGTSPGLSIHAPKAQGLSQGYALGSTEDPWNRNWVPLPSLPDTELSRHQSFMWGRSYDLHRNNGFVAGPSTRLAALVGELVPQFKSSNVQERDALTKLWKSWARQATSDGVGSWAMFCETLVGNACQGGDVLCLFDHRPELGGKIPLRLKQVDAWRVGHLSEVDKDGKKIALGVKKDRGMEIGYYVTRENGDAPYYFERIRDGRPGAVLFRRPDPLRRPEQSRATPIATAYLSEVKDAWDHARHHSRSAGSRARQKAILQAGDPQEIKKIFQAAKQAEDAGNADEARLIRQSAKASVVETPEASTLILPKWADYKATPTDTVDPSFTEYMKGQLQSVAPGWGLGHEVAYLRMEEANFARARIHFMQAQSEVKRWIRDIGTMIGDPLIQLFVQYAWAHGYLEQDPTDEATDVEWHGLPVEYMDLGAEISAYGDGQVTGVMSPQAIARRNNTDWETTLTERIEFARRHRDLMKQYGLTDQDLNSAFGERADAPADSAAQQEKAP